MKYAEYFVTELD